MTKSDFKEYKGTEVLCESCGRILPTKCFSYKSIRQNNTALRCKRCDWLKRHETVPKIEGFSEEEIIKSYENISNTKLDCPILEDEINIWIKIDSAYINYMRGIGIYE